jgi:hypothetical protein
MYAIYNNNDSYSVGEENARSSTEDKGGSSKGQGKIRKRTSGDQPIQSEIYGGYDSGFREVPRNGSSTVAILQRRTFWHSQMFKHFPRSTVSMPLICANFFT